MEAITGPINVPTIDTSAWMVPKTVNVVSYDRETGEVTYSDGSVYDTNTDVITFSDGSTYDKNEMLASLSGLSQQDVANVINQTAVDPAEFEAAFTNASQYVANLSYMLNSGPSAPKIAEYFDNWNALLSGDFDSTRNVNQRDDAYNDLLATELHWASQNAGSWDDVRTIAGLPDYFSVYDKYNSKDNFINETSVKDAYSKLMSGAPLEQVLSDYYGTEITLGDTTGSDYTNMGKYGASDQEMFQQFQSIIKPITEMALPYIMLTQGLEYGDAMAYMYTHDPMVAAVYGMHGVDLFRQTSDGSTYIFDPIQGQEVRTLEVKDATVADFLPAIATAVVTWGATSGISAMLAAPAAGSAAAAAGGTTGFGLSATASDVIAGVLVSGATSGWDPKQMLAAAFTAGVDLDAYELNSFVEGAIKSGAASAITGNSLDDVLKTAFLGGVASWGIEAFTDWTDSFDDNEPISQESVDALQEGINEQVNAGLEGMNNLLNSDATASSTAAIGNAQTLREQAVEAGQAGGDALEEVVVNAQRIYPNLSGDALRSLIQQWATEDAAEGFTFDDPAENIDELAPTYDLEAEAEAEAEAEGGATEDGTASAESGIDEATPVYDSETSREYTVDENGNYVSSNGTILDPVTLQPVGVKTIEDINDAIYTLYPGSNPLNSYGYELATRMTSIWGAEDWEKFRSSITPDNPAYLFGHEITWDMIYGDDPKTVAVDDVVEDDTTLPEETPEDTPPMIETPAIVPESGGGGDSGWPAVITDIVNPDMESPAVDYSILDTETPTTESTEETDGAASETDEEGVEGGAFDPNADTGGSSGVAVVPTDMQGTTGGSTGAETAGGVGGTGTGSTSDIAGQGESDEGDGTAAGTGTGDGTGDGAGDGSGSGDGLGAGDALGYLLGQGGGSYTLKPPELSDITYLYDFSSIFATPEQEAMYTNFRQGLAQGGKVRSLEEVNRELLRLLGV